MKKLSITTYVQTRSEIDALALCPDVVEVLIEPRATAIRGHLSNVAANELAKAAITRNLKPVLICDAPLPQRQAEQFFAALKELNFTDFSAVRFHDVGIGNWFKTNAPETNLQMLMEIGNHNWSAITGWQEYFGKQLTKIILSIELPKQKILEYVSRCRIDCEILGAGSIPLFHSARSLLRPLEIEDTSETAEQIVTFVASDEMSGRLLPSLETQHGSLLYLNKDFFIFEHAQEFAEAGLCSLRLDAREFDTSSSNRSNLKELCQLALSSPDELKTIWPRKTITPFLRNNKTDAQFERLKSHLHSLRDDSCVATVIATQKPGPSVIQINQDFTVSGAFELLLPTGAVEKIPELHIRDINGAPVLEATLDRIALTSIRKATPGALIRRLSPL